VNAAQASTLLAKVQPLLAFLAGLFGLVIGAYFSRRADRLRQLEIVRSSAYADFLRGAAGLAAMNPTISAVRSKVTSS
jgi:short subunit fatty acids transporter